MKSVNFSFITLFMTIFIALYYDNFIIIQYLHQHGADLNQKLSNDRTVLHIGSF